MRNGKIPRYLIIFALACLLLTLLQHPSHASASQTPLRAEDDPVEPSIIVQDRTGETIDFTITFPENPLVPTMGRTASAPFNDAIYSHPSETGIPDLPVLRKAVEVPFSADVTVSIIDSKFDTAFLQDLGLPDTIPDRQPELSKCAKSTAEDFSPDGSPFPASTTAGFFPEKPVQLTQTYILRGHRIAQITLWPVQYRAQTGQVRIYSQITLRLSFSGADDRLTDEKGRKYASLAFDSLLIQNVLNLYQGNESPLLRDAKTEGYLIVAPDAFLNSLASFASFKESQGFTVTRVGLSTAGTTPEAIKAYIQNAYDTWLIPPTYVLLVGDVNNGAYTLPAFSAQAAQQAATDLYYGTTDGQDWIPDIFVGRLPVRNLSQLNAVINKLTGYETLSGEEAWVKKAALIASDDPTNWHIAESTQNVVIQNHTQPEGFIGSFPTNPNPGGDKLYGHSYAADRADVITAINYGRSLIAYTGHGSRSAWGGPAFTQTDITNITAENVFSLVASFACITGDFSVTESFGETWLLEVGKGAIAFIGSSESSYWGPDDVLERAMMNTLFGNDPRGNLTGRLFYDGLMAVEAGYPGTGIGQSQYYWETYNLLGDPSLAVLIEPRTPDFSLTLNPPDMALCQAGEEDALVTVNQINGYSQPVTLSLDSLPPGVLGTFSQNPVTPSGTSTMTLSVGLDAAPGDYELTLSGTSTDLQRYLQAGFHIFNQPPDLTRLASPANGTENVPTNPLFQWEPLPNAHTYTIEIAGDPDFENILISDSGITQEEYLLQQPLSTNATYYWRVRGINSCGAGSASASFWFTTKPSPGDCPPEMEPLQLYQTNFEAPPEDWTHSGMEDSWTWQTDRYLSPFHAFFAVDWDKISLQHLISPSIQLPDLEEAPIAIKFWHTFDIEESATGCYDGALLEISQDNGQSWQIVSNDQLITTSYNGLIATNYNNPMAGAMAWCGTQNWTETIVDLDPVAGQEIRIRFTQTTDESIGQLGWTVDDFLVQSCQPLPAYQPQFFPAQSKEIHEPESLATIHFLLENHSLNSDAYALDLSSELWEASLLTPCSVLLNPGETSIVTITVLIPSDAVFGEAETITLTATSLNDPQTPPAEAAAVVEITAGYPLYLPFIEQTN